MEPMQSNMSSSMASSKNKRVLWIVVAVAIVVVVLAWWYMYRRAPGSSDEGASTSVEAQEPLSGGDTAADIGRDLEAVDLGNVDSELNALDQDINQL